MTPLSAEQEQELKEQCREIFYAGLLPTIARANTEPHAIVLDLIRGNHSLQDVIFGVPPTAPPSKPMIYPLRTYEMIREFKAKEAN